MSVMRAGKMGCCSAQSDGLAADMQGRTFTPWPVAAMSVRVFCAVVEMVIVVCTRGSTSVLRLMKECRMLRSSFVSVRMLFYFSHWEFSGTCGLP